MSALDKYHGVVRRALEKDGWTITDDQMTVFYGRRRVIIDLGAEKLLAAEKENQKIAVEIKTFGSLSPMTDLERAIGQFGLYSSVLAQVEPDRLLFVAVPLHIYQTLFQEPVGQIVLRDLMNRVIVYAADAEEIDEWIPPF